MSRSARLVSAIGVALAALYALPTLWWRFGRDQGLFESMGRDWLGGRLPYVDAWDQKPPGIHAIYALGAAFGGASEWPIRALEIVAVLLTGFVVARLAVRTGAQDAGAVSPGIAALFGASFQFTCFCWWHTGQVEPWEALAVLGSALVAERASGGRSWLLAGFLGGVAFLFKLPAVVLLAVIVGRQAWARRAAPAGAASVVALYGAGGAVAVLLGVMPWLLTGTFRALWELVVEYNAVYARHKAVHAVPMHVWAGVYAWPWLMPAFALFAAAARRLLHVPDLRVRWQEPLSGAVGLLLAALATVAMQPNNYMYHWSVVVPFVTLLAAVSANALLDDVDVAPGPSNPGRRRHAQGRVLAVTGTFVLAGFALAPRWEQQHEWNYRRYVVTWLDVQLGRAPADTLLEGFRARHMKGPGARPFGYVWADVERLSTAIRARAQAGDTLCARWFEPVFYTRTGLHCTSRFTTEHGWRDKDVPFKLAEWEAEHDGALQRTPPTFMVTRLTDTADRALLASRGYAEVAEAGRYVALELRK